MTTPKGRLSDQLEQLITIRDESARLLAFIAIDSTVAGPAFGGIRRVRYGSEADAMADATRLAVAMTQKCALADLAAGGGKTVIARTGKLDLETAYEHVARAVEALGGSYVCGPDVGTGADELDVVRRCTSYVDRPGNDAGEATAAGVVAALRGLCGVRFGSEDLGDRSFAIEGLGAVGLAVARQLVDFGAQVRGYDVLETARVAAAAIGVELVDANAVWNEPCDVAVPCALGGCVDQQRARSVKAAAICGSANNQVGDDDEDSIQTLHDRRVLWVPDVVSSAGAVIQGVVTFAAGPTDGARAEVARRIEAVEATTRSLLLEARAQDLPPARLAHQWATARVTERTSR